MHRDPLMRLLVVARRPAEYEDPTRDGDHATTA